MTKRAWILVAVTVAAVAACGGGGESADERVARTWVEDAIAGRASKAWDALHPAVQASTTREAYTTCITSRGAISGATVTVVESTTGTYVARDGSVRHGVQVVVRMTARGAADQTALWVVDGRVAGAGAEDPNDAGCARRL